MSRQYFGTDGIRGRVGQSPITPDFLLRLGFAAGKVLATSVASLAKGKRPTVIIGKDTRISGYMCESALQSGLSAAGIDVLLTGPLPTPAIAHLTRALRAQAGIVISASHNPYEDNGIKFFSESGAKLDDAVEEAIEQQLTQAIEVVPSSSLGRAKRITDAAGRYIEFCKSTFPNTLDLRGLRIILDCANGACYQVAPCVFHELGAEVITIGNQPDGFNINHHVGSTYPQQLRDEVLKQGADIGIALDGDGDRVVMVDETGQLLDGDQLLYIIAMHRQARGKLSGGIVGTQMSNLALEHALNKENVPFARAKVGDRHVLELLNQHGWELGGENSGHILCLDKHTSGDGIISALQVLFALRASACKLSMLASSLTLYPQVLINVDIKQKIDIQSNQPIRDAVQKAEITLGTNGRVLLRASGTEAKIRVMVEGNNHSQVTAIAHDLAKVVASQAMALT